MFHGCIIINVLIFILPMHSIYMYFMQSESTLWKLKFFVQDVFEAQGKSAATEANNNNSKSNANNQASNKRKRETTDALAKTSQKKSKKP